MPSPETSRENGQLGGRPEGSKSWKTIEKEKLREHYLDEMRKNFAELTNIHIKEAKQNRDERIYAINQTIGKPAEKVEVEQTTILKLDV